MEEVDESHLPGYLTELKRNGWTLVGLEQTVSSVDLRQAKFPDKMVLVLGNEKEGVPSEIIQMLDLCIEIPQYGIIRSLNVHVSGSILLWEYISLILERKGILDSADTADESVNRVSESVFVAM